MSVQGEFRVGVNKKKNKRSRRISGADVTLNRTLGFGAKKRLKFYRKLSSFLVNNVPLQNSLDNLYSLASKKGKKPRQPQAVIIDDIRRTLNDGQKFSSAIGRWVPREERILAQAGEDSGGLAGSLKNIIELTIATGKIRSTFIKGLSNPAALVVAIIALLQFFGRYIIPDFAKTIPVERLTGAPASMVTMSDIVVNYTPHIGLSMIGLTALVIYSLPRWRGKLRAIADHLPPWSIYRLVQGVTFLLSASALIKSNVKDVDALEKIRLNASPWLRERLDAILYEMNNGARNMGEAMARTGFNFPTEEIVADLEVYSSNRDFSEALDLIAREWLEEGLEFIERMTTRIRYFVTVCLVLVIAQIVLGMLGIPQFLSQ